MAEDIGIELHDKIKQAFDARCGKDSTLSHVKRKIENGTATMEDTSVYARRLGELLRKSIESTTKPDDLPGEKMYFNIAQSILEPLLRDNYDDVNTICEEVQSALDAKKGLGLKPQKADFPAERIRAAIGGAAVKETAEHAIQVLGRTAENITGSFQTDYIKKNAEFRSKAGLNCYIERKDGHNCCDWCAKLSGKYRYPDEVPRDVYRRHDNCTCDVSYVSEKGRQNVHSKRWANEQAKAQRIAYAASLPKPMKLTKAEAIAKESEILAQRRLTYDRKRGIINKKIGYRMYDIYYENGDDLFEPDAIDSELEKSNVGRYTMRYIEEKPLSIEMNYSLEQDEYEMGHIYGNTITINAPAHANEVQIAETIIHETAHKQFSWDNTQEDEINCRIYEYFHTHDSITEDKIKEIVNFVKEYYPDLPRGDLYGY